MFVWFAQYNELSDLAYPNCAKAVFILFMIMVPILLLNMLIAMMGNTYSQVIERSEKEWVKQVWCDKNTVNLNNI